MDSIISALKEMFNPIAVIIAEVVQRLIVQSIDLLILHANDLLARIKAQLHIA